MAAISPGTATSADGVAIHFASQGAGERALVFVHGWSCDRTYWRHQLPAFADRYRAIALDLAGHGESGLGRADWTMAAFGADVAAVVDQLGLEDVVLIGHSMGGDAVVEAALLLGERVTGLVWVDVYPQLDRPSPADEVQAFVDTLAEDFATRTRAFVKGMFPPTTDPELVAWIAEDMASAPPEVALNAVVHARNGLPAAAAGLQRLAPMPMLVIDPERAGTDAESLRRHGVGRIKILADIGHFPMLEDAARFNRVLDDWLGTLPAKR